MGVESLIKTTFEVTLMIHSNNPVIKHKAGLLNLAEELNNSRNSYLPMQNSVSKKNWACELQGREQAGIARLRRLAKIRLFVLVAT